MRPPAKPTAKVVRYRAGQAPHYAKPSDPTEKVAREGPSNIEDAFEETHERVHQEVIVAPLTLNQKQATPPPPMAPKEDPRLKRLAKYAAFSGTAVEPEQQDLQNVQDVYGSRMNTKDMAPPTITGRRRRAKFQGEVVVAQPTSSAAEETPEVERKERESDQNLDSAQVELNEEEQRRERLRQRRMELEREAEAASQEITKETAALAVNVTAAVMLSTETSAIAPKSASPSSSSSEEEEDTSSSEDEQAVIPKAVFIPKSARQSVTVKEREEIEHEKVQQQKQRTKEQRQEDSHALVAELVKRDLLGDDTSAENGNLFNGIDDTDDLDQEAEYEAWRLRELLRIKRDRDSRDAWLQEQEVTERRRQMTDAERRKDDQSAGIDRFSRERTQQKFMQRYYHKGAFYQDSEEEVLKRDTSAPTLEDRFNRDLMPEVMQVKKFGLKGRTKWTHLANEDTSRQGVKIPVHDSTLKRLGGAQNHVFERPAVKKRKE